MRFFFALLLVCALAATAHARGRKCHGDCPPMAAELELTLGVAQLSLATTVFSTTTVSPSTQKPETISVTGRNVGAVRPMLFVAEVHEAIMAYPHIAFGFKMGFMSADLGKTVVAQDGAIVSAANSTGFLMGPELRGVFSRGPFEVRGGFSFGYRETDMYALNRFYACKSGTCQAALSAEMFFFEPRVEVMVKLPVVSVGGYFGGDVMPTGGWSAGGLITARLGDWDKLGDARTWSRRGLYH